jgi:hypothetical protein
MIFEGVGQSEEDRVSAKRLSEFLTSIFGSEIEEANFNYEQEE